MSRRYAQGRFIPKHPEKYRGNPTRIFYRSGYELKMMHYLDLHSGILEWNSEEVIIPYRDPANGHKMRRYYPDFWVRRVDRQGKITECIVEIKPASQTKPPIKKSRVTNRYIRESVTYATNHAKWEAAKAYCDKRGYDFIILTEKELNIK